MASIWMQKKGHARPRKLAGHMDPASATFRLRALEAQWAARGTGRRITRVDGLSTLLYDEKGSLCGLLYLEPMSPPTLPDKGDTRVPAAAKH